MSTSRVLPTVWRVVRLIEVEADDLKAVTDAILSEWTETHVSGGGHSYCLCRYCSQEQHVDWKTVGCDLIREYHDKDCPVLIARSIEPNPKDGLQPTKEKSNA